MAKAGAWLIVVGLSVGALSVVLYLARRTDVAQDGVLFDASPYVVWGGIAGVAVTCGTVLVAAAQVIVVLSPDDPTPPLRKTAGPADRPRSHWE